MALPGIEPATFGFVAQHLCYCGPENCTKHLLNRLNEELNPICHLLELVGAHPILHVTRIRVNIFCV